MADCGEQQSLLNKALPDRDNHRLTHFDRLFSSGDDQGLVCCSDEDNWIDSNSSSCSSYYSDCHSSSVAEWESEISPEGELFYIESFAQPKYHQNQSAFIENDPLKDEITPGPSQDTKKKTTTKGKLVRLIRRRSSRKSTRKKTVPSENLNRDDTETNSKSANKVTFREPQVTIKQSELVRQIVSGYTEQTNNENLPLWVVYVTQEDDAASRSEGMLYCWPRENNNVCAARGAFLTLHHLLPDLTSSHAMSSTISYEGLLAHVIYTAEAKELFLLALPSSRCTLKEAVLLNTDVVQSLRFTYQTLSRCFSNKENHSALDRMFSLLQTQYVSSSQINLLRFEDLLPAAQLIALPRDAQVQIDDALSELESNDFGCYSDDKDCQRLYSIIGSCLFYKGYLLASHLPKDDLMDINAFCRHNGLLSLNKAESVKNVVVWKEVFPASCNRGLPAITLTYFLPQGRWFLLLVGQEEAMLAIILESGGCTVKIEGNPGPEPIYVKQAQATLQHMKEIEVLSLADKWIQNHCRLQTISPDLQCKIPPTSPVDTSANISTPDFSPKSTQSHNDTSEDSISQAASSGVSDEAAPILGRRAEREKATDSNSYSRFSDSDFSDDSDWAPFKESHQSGFGSRLFDLSDVGKNLLADVEFSLPVRLTAGEQNALFHYVHLDYMEGVVLCSPTQSNSARLRLVMDNFRVMAPVIHDLLQNTVRFKKLKVQEVSECLINKTLIANKEHAMLFECPPAKSDVTKKSTPLTYWVVGRLFFMPHPREVYVCYQDTSPQNLVELAFRLAFNASG